MRSRRPSQQHSDAVARRLAELSAQLAAAPEPTAAPPLDPAVGDDWWSDHTRVVQRPPLTVVPAAPPVGPPAALPAALPAAPPSAPASAPPAAPPAGALPGLPGGSPTAGPALPVPGRHAARRPLAWVPDLVPPALRGGVRLGSAQVTAVALLVTLGLAVTCWWVVRSDPKPLAPVALEQAAGAAPVVPILPPSVEDPAPGGAAQPPAAAAEAAPVVVDVAGRVRRPGIVVLDAGARVVDALEQAGGARPGVDLTPLNLARVLVDGEQIVVGVDGTPAAAPAAPAAPVAPGTSGDPVAPAALVDLNLADQALLETLPQVGPVTATAIIAWRTEHGAFTAVTELLEVDGIGDATLAQLTPLVTV